MDNRNHKRRRQHEISLLSVLDGFTKYIRLFPTKTTNTVEIYFRDLSVPARIVTDRGATFTLNTF